MNIPKGQAKGKVVGEKRKQHFDDEEFEKFTKMGNNPAVIQLLFEMLALLEEAVGYLKKLAGGK